MPRYIDAEKVEKWSWQEPRYSDSINDRTDLRDFLKSLPTVSHGECVGAGEWIDMGDFEQCSVCKGTHLKEFQSKYGKTTWIRTPYCPNCGARMNGEEDKS